MNIAHAAFPEGYRKDMILTTFRGSLNHVYLQRHLLAVQPQTLDDAIRAGNEFLLVQSSTNPTSVRQVLDETDDDTSPGEVCSVNIVSNDPMALLLDAIKHLTDKVASLEKKNVSRKESVCYECRKAGHFKRDCPTLNNKSHGNAGSPQQ